MCYFSVGWGSLIKKILVLFPNCFTCISDRNKTIANHKTFTPLYTFFTYFIDWCWSVNLIHLLQIEDIFFWNIMSLMHLMFYAELSSPMPLESDMKKQEHLWQNQSPNFLAEKAFNAAVAALQPHCAICSLFCPYAKVPPHKAAHVHMSQWSINGSDKILL